MRNVFALVHAPSLGPASWNPVAGRLAAAGWDVAVPSLAGFAEGGAPYVRALVNLAAGQVRTGPDDRVVLVPHSGAGAFAPYLSARIRAREIDVIFADAGLPPGRPEATAVGSGAFDYMRDLVRDGMVPPWPQWWPRDVLAGLFPDEESQRLVTGEAPALPLEFYRERLPPTPPSWPARRCGYLRFSQSYLHEAEEASRRGWPVRHLPGEHLHMVVDPAEVAAGLIALAGELRALSAAKPVGG